MKKMLMSMALAASCAGAAGENLFYNSSFELGIRGWDQGGLTCYKYPYDPATPSVRRWMKAADAPFGTHVMQITLGKKLAGQWLLVSPEVKLVPGKKYTASFYVKPEKNGRISYSMHSNHFSKWSSAASDSPELEGGKWQRVHKTFVYRKKGKNQDEGYDHFFLLFNTPLNGLTYQFDGMQFEEGELTDYKPAADVEYKLTTQNLYLKETDKITVSLSAYSYDKKTEASADLILRDTGKQKDLQKKNIKFDLVPGLIRTQEITFDKLPYGGFRIHVPDTEKPVAVDFVRIHSNDEVYQPGKFALGIGTHNLGISVAPSSLDIGKVHFQANRYTVDEGEAVRLSGAVVSSNFDVASMSLATLLPEKRGKYDWKYLDGYYARLRQLKLKSLESIASQVLMTVVRNRNTGAFVPDWLRKRDRTGHPEGVCNGSWKHVRTVLPPPEVIAETAAAVVKRYKDDIAMFRLFAEINGYLKPEQAFEYSKAVYEAVRKVSPETLLNAINATEDFGSSTGGFISDFLKFGGGKYTDVISFHPYRSSQDDSAVSAMEGIKGFREIMKQYGVDLKLAETECFYLIPNPNPNQPEYSWNIFGPAAVARRIMIDMGEGLLFSIPLEVYHLHQAQAGNQECHREYFLKVPNANFAAHNAAGYFLNGAENGCRIGLPGNELCYTFEKNGRKFSSIWCISGKSNMTLNLPAGVSCKVYDFYGNLIKKADKILSRTLDRDPLFIEWSDDADVKAIHSSGDYAPLQAVQFHGVQQMDGGIGLLITNRTSKPISGVAGLNSKYLKSVKTKFSGIQPHANSCIVIPVKIKPDAPETFPLTAVCIVDGKFLSQKVTLKQVPVLKPDQEYPLGPHKFKLEKKGNKLLFTGFLSSRNPKVSPNPKTPWEGDSIEIFCDYAPERYNPNKLDVFNDFCVQFCIPADKDGSPVPLVLRSRQNFELKNVNVVRSADGAQVTALLPYRKGMHFNIHFNAEGKTAVLNGKRNFKDRSGYAVIAE